MLVGPSASPPNELDWFERLLMYQCCCWYINVDVVNTIADVALYLCLCCFMVIGWLDISMLLLMLLISFLMLLVRCVVDIVFFYVCWYINVDAVNTNAVVAGAVYCWHCYFLSLLLPPLLTLLCGCILTFSMFAASRFFEVCDAIGCRWLYRYKLKQDWKYAQQIYNY